MANEPMTRERAIARLKEVAEDRFKETYTPSLECGIHIIADAVLCERLIELGEADIVEQWHKTNRHRLLPKQCYALSPPDTKET